MRSVRKKPATGEIYNDPHKLDPLIKTSEPVVVLTEERSVACFIPIHSSSLTGTARTGESGRPDFRARFLGMWGADAFQSQISVLEDFAPLRSGRLL